MTRPRTPFQVLLICCAVLGVYYPTIFGEISLLDDLDLVNGLLNLQDYDLKGLFFPRQAGGGYYRPLIAVSFIFDRFAWFLQPEMMHLENVLLHLANALLIFAVSRLLFDRAGRPSLFPLVAALLFGLHPLATESVCWISGRTDPLAALFVLSSLWFVVKSLQSGKRWFLIPAVLTMGAGGLAKETALAMIPAAILVMLGWHEEKTHGSDARHLEGRYAIILTACVATTAAVAVSTSNFWLVSLLALISFGIFCSGLFREKPPPHRGMRFAMILGGSGLFCMAVSWVIRRSAFTSDLDKIGQTVTHMTSDLGYTVQLFLGAEAFYARKFLLPLPLNAAIREIDPLYSLAGTLLLVLCLYLLARPSLFAGLVLGGFCMTIPALPLAFGTIAWTAYAERYVYLALPFWLLASGCLLTPQVRKTGRLLPVGTTLLILLLAGATFQRTTVWNRNIDLYADMAEKSPDFKAAHGLYMQALLQKKRYREAEEQYRIARGLYSLSYEEQYDLLMASVWQEQGRTEEAGQLYLTAYGKSRGQKPSVLKALIAFFEGKGEKSPPEERVRYERLVLEFTRQLYALDKDPHTLYRLAKLHLRLDEKSAAVAALEEVVQRLPASDPERAAAEKLLSRQ